MFFAVWVKPARLQNLPDHFSGNPIRPKLPDASPEANDV